MTNVVKPACLALAATMLMGIAPQSRGAPSPQLLDLLDPTRPMRQLCGGGKNAGAALRLRLAQAAFVQAAGAKEAPVGLIPGLGNHDFPVTTRNAVAQRFFDQGLMLSYGFNHAEAIRAFREAQRLDPDCAMCWWGEAYAHGPNINAPMDEKAFQPALSAARRALALAGKATPVERSVIEAIQKRYAEKPPADRVALDLAYADAMLEVARRFPDNDDVAVLAAEAVMDTRPWDYWESDGRTPKGKIGEAVALVEKVVQRSPDHPQGAHLYIHLMESTANPAQAEAAADRLATPLVPAAGHLVHMPGHLYYRVGRYKDAIRVNVAAAKVDADYLQRSHEQGLYRFGYYPHNVHFIVTSAQMAGDIGTAITEARRLGTILNTDVTAAMPWVQPVDAAPYLAFAQFAEPAAILKMPPPDKRLPYVTAMWHYARAVAYAQQRNDAGNRAEIDAIAKIRTTTDFKPMTDQLVPAPDLLRLAEAVAQGRLAYAHGRYAEAAKLYRAAATIESGVRYMEPPFWYYPVSQSLGAALYEAKDYAGARQAFLDALAQAPNNGWALYGLAMTQRAMGDGVAAAASEAALDKAWLGKRAWLKMNRL